MKILYSTTATATGDGRNGHTATEDGQVDVDVRVPTEMGGPGGATNPEQLFAAGYAACFHSAMKLVAGSLGRSHRRAPRRSADRVAPAADNVTCRVRRPAIGLLGRPNG